MTDLTMNFTYPWLLLLLVPALVAAFIPYFRLSKKYRRTRNRVTSLVLHVIVTICAVLVLSGLSFSYNVPKEGNEVMLVVDLSDTEERSDLSAEPRDERSADARDAVVKALLDMCEENGLSAGVVTFGFDQVYAVPFTKDAAAAYSMYVNAELPDGTATDIASALNYSRTLFTHPDTGKIVLITDGKQTDGNALTAIADILHQNTKIDFIDVSTYYTGADAQVTAVTYPEYHVKPEDLCSITVTVQANKDGRYSLTMADKGVVASTKEVDVRQGTVDVVMAHAFAESGLHEMTFTLSSADDTVENNNVFTSYYDIQSFNNVLVLEGVKGQSAKLGELLTETNYVATVRYLYEDEIPSTVDDLRAYDQIILNNVANADLTNETNPNVPEGFADMIYDYVDVYGGGLLTVGGNEAGDDAVAHAYSKEDLNRSTLQQLLPVEAIDYTPPLGVVFIIDISGSMSVGATDGKTRLEWAVLGMDTCLKALTERDYVGIVTLYSSGSNTYDVVLPMTARTQESTIREAIYSIDKTKGSTVFSDAINAAGRMLRANTLVEKKHIIIVTDGQPDSGDTTYCEIAHEYYVKDGTSLSVVAIGVKEGDSAGQKMEELVAQCNDEEGNPTGKVYYVPRDNAEAIGTDMRNDLMSPSLKEVNYVTFRPTVANILSPLVVDLERYELNDNKLNVTLEGFYGVKARSNADLILTGDYNVPIYAQWKHGNGMVGSFMCDLNGVWSADFMASEVGKTFLTNAIENLMPTSPIQPKEISFTCKEDNYTNTLAITESTERGESIKGTLTSVSTGAVVDLNATEQTDSVDGVFVRKPISASNGYSSCEFIVKNAGVYLITLVKLDADGNEIASHSFYKAFAYSREYDVAFDENFTPGKETIENLASVSDGEIVKDMFDPVEIFNDFVLVLNKIYDPRYLLIIVAIVLFLIDIIVRKFKFKWLHELFMKKSPEKAGGEAAYYYEKTKQKSVFPKDLFTSKSAALNGDKEKDKN